MGVADAEKSDVRRTGAASVGQPTTAAPNGHGPAAGVEGARYGSLFRVDFFTRGDNRASTRSRSVIAAAKVALVNGPTAKAADQPRDSVEATKELDEFKAFISL